MDNRVQARKVHDGDVTRLAVHVPLELAETAEREEHGGGQVRGPGGEGRGHMLVALDVILGEGRHRRPRELGEARWEARGLPADTGVRRWEEALPREGVDAPGGVQAQGGGRGAGMPAPK